MAFTIFQGLGFLGVFFWFFLTFCGGVCLFGLVWFLVSNELFVGSVSLSLHDCRTSKAGRANGIIKTSKQKGLLHFPGSKVEAKNKAVFFVHRT